MKRKNPLLILFGGAVTILVFGLFFLMAWSYAKWNVGKPLTTLDPQGPNATSIQNLANPVFMVAGFVFLGVMGAVLFIGFKFRDKGDEETADEIPHQLHGKTWAEIAWTLAPALILFVIALATVVTLSELNAAPKPEALKVKVEGQQWWWKFSYDFNNDSKWDAPGDVVTANELVIPIGTEVALTQTSNDVIHSFWIPALNGKKDAVPGMTTDWKLQADKVGVYRGQCTEFCGLSHANMRMLVRAVTPEDFAKWRTNQQTPAKNPAAGTLEAAGRDVFKAQLCASCHLIRGVNDQQVLDPAQGAKSLLVAGTAPELTHFASRGTFAGSIFNSHYPNPDEVGDTVPFGQTCKVRGLKGSADINGNVPNEQSLPDCRTGAQTDAMQTQFSPAPGNPNNPADANVLRDWLRDPPAMKPMAPEPSPEANGRRRGMPNLKLSEDQITQLVAYLNSLT